MPTFETNVPPAAKPSDKSDPGLASEFRPRRREQWGSSETSETFDPAPIPPAVKKSIDQRVNEIMRQCRGPDETFFAIREWFSTARRILCSIPALVRDLVSRREDDADDENDETQSDSGESQKPRENKPQARKDDGQKQRQQQHRGRRGGRRHGRHGGGRGRQNPGQGRNNSSDGD